MDDVIRIWHKAFADPAGGFYERLDENRKPLDLPRRLLTQCRQIYVYAKSGMDMGEAFDRMEKTYRDPNGGWRFSERDGGYDLYAHAFVILAASATRREEAARKTLSFIEDRFGFGGTAQNPYMHLFESCLAMAEISDDPIYRGTAAEILNLVRGRFLDGVIFEQQGGTSVEAGHQSEWIWLLDQYGGEDGTMRQLWDWVKAHGFDPDHGGIFNSQKADGALIDDKKRIWPVCETIRAARVMGDERLADDLKTFLKTHYLTKDGFWHEVLNRDLTPATDYLPGTTPYHLFGL